MYWEARDEGLSTRANALNKSIAIKYREWKSSRRTCSSYFHIAHLGGIQQFLYKYLNRIHIHLSNNKRVNKFRSNKVLCSCHFITANHIWHFITDVRCTTLHYIWNSLNVHKSLLYNWSCCCRRCCFCVENTIFETSHKKARTNKVLLHCHYIIALHWFLINLVDERSKKGEQKTNKRSF